MNVVNVPRKDTELVLLDGRRLAYAEYGEAAGAPVFLSEIREMLVKDFREALRTGGQGMVDDMNANHGQPWGFPLNEIKIRVQLWCGEVDQSAPRCMSKYLSSTIPKCDATFIPGAGHLWILDHLHEVLEAVQCTTGNAAQKIVPLSSARTGNRVADRRD
jgi:pimeloyl-ACP methyl ester carboxylesterase